MLSGVKFIPRDKLNTDLDLSVKERKKSSSRKEKHTRKKKNSNYDSSDDEGTKKIKKNSKRSKKWYTSDDYSSSSLSESESGNSSDLDEKKRRIRGKEKKTRDESSADDAGHKLKKRSRKSKKHYSSDEYSSFASESEGELRRGRREDANDQSKERGRRKSKTNDSRGSVPEDKDKEQGRKEIGLEWMLKPVNNPARMSTQTNDLPEEPQVEEVKKPNPREMNPYLQDNGSGYPEDVDQTKAGVNILLSSSVVGDGGASWRLKALKRSQEQAAREGRKLEEVVEERWGSLGQLAVSAASRAAPVRAHLHAIRDRKRGVAERHETASDDQINQDTEKVHGDRREYLRNVSLRHPKMREPKVHDSLSWRKRKGQNMSAEDAQLISAAVSSINKFANDGSFMHGVTHHQNKDSDGSIGSHTNIEGIEHKDLDLVPSKTNKPSEESPVVTQALSANKLAAQAMQLRMKGKHEEAEKLLKEVEIIKMKQDNGPKLASQATEGSASRYVMRDTSVREKRKEEDADVHLAQKIVQNKQYSISGRADDEYDFDDGPSRKRNRKRGGMPEQLTEKNNFAMPILTQQERCQFCFENPTRPRHLVVSIANFTYLMLPQWQPVVQGHCCILPLQHESATRNVDNNVWEEIRNFKKCLIMMFAKQEKDVVFLETVMRLAQQRRHCLVECIPLPREIARQAPLYFKKAIDEAEDEWSQHNAKKLIDTSKKGLRGSIPKDFPYFHVEFGLNKGFVHVIDDETQFKSSLGLNVIRGMLEEDMCRRQKHESVETQKQAVASFTREWEPFDWTKELN